MFEIIANLIHRRKSCFLLCVMVILALLAPTSAFADKKKKKGAPTQETKDVTPPDYSNIVWPNPPAIARIKYQAFYSAEKLSQIEAQQNTKKAKWMDRLAGTQTAADGPKPFFQLGEPYGIAVDSKGNVYTADQKVGAIFIFNTETRELELMKNGVAGHFAHIIGLAMDDGDRLFVSDPILRHVLVFNAAHKAEDVITEGMVSPGCMTIDRENRLLYVSDIELDQVLVYDADTLKLKRKIGTTGHKHELTTPGDFAKPSGLAVDQDGNLYVCDTLNDRIEVFDADGKFVETYGKNGDGPGYFARPKGVAIDSDGHIWVADGMQDKVQVFNKDWQLLIRFGGHGLLPGMFEGLVGIIIDKNNRIFTSEIAPGRLQQFQYVTDAQAEKLQKERDAQRAKTAGTNANPPASAPASTPTTETKTPPPSN